MNTTENNKIIAEFMNYANNRPLTDSLLNTLYKYNTDVLRYKQINLVL